MTDLDIRPYEEADEAAVIGLWHDCGLIVPWNDPKTDIARIAQADGDPLIVGQVDGRVAASVMVGYDGHRGWIHFLAVSPELQRRGIGRRMMAAAEDKLRRLGCPKINLQVRTPNKPVIAFYRRLGFAVDDAVSLGKRID